MYKRVILWAMLCALACAQEEFRADFQMFDSNDDGRIELQEVVRSFPDVTISEPGPYISQFFRDYDTNSDQVIEFAEYKQARIQQIKLQEEQQQNMAQEYYMHEDF